MRESGESGVLAAARGRSRLRRMALGVGVTAIAGIGSLAAASGAQAFAFSDFAAGVLTDADDRTAYFQTAGGRPPFGVTDFSFQTNGSGEPVGNAKNLRIDIPQGLAPNFPAIPTCTDAQLEAEDCPGESQIGVQRLTARGTLTLLGRQTLEVELPIYNMTRSSGQVARFAFNPAQAPGSYLLQGDKSPVIINGGVRNTDYGLFFTISDLPSDPAVVRSNLAFWGVPGAARHDGDRGVSTTKISTLPLLPVPGSPKTVNGGPVSNKDTAFLTNPTSCAGVQTSTVWAESYAGEQISTSYTTPVGVESCGDVPFAPTAELGSAEPIVRDSPLPLSVGLRVPQSQTAARGTAHVKRIAVTLPDGATINPSAANGLEACTDEQFGKGTETPIACPAGSHVASVQITTPLLDGSLGGSAYIGQPLPGNRYRLFVNADGFGITVRLIGTVVPDPATGQLTAVFDDNPQVPFSDLELQFKGGPNAALSSPLTCGQHGGVTAFDPWSGTPAVNASTLLDVGGCDDGFPFAPAVAASTASTQAGAYTPLSLGLGRNDGSQTLRDLSITLPPGQTARIRDVEQCSGVQAVSASCPASTQIGTVTTKAGSGSDPLTLTGKLYFTGAYNGGSFGTVAAVRAVAGPYDLGTVVVRQSLRIDPYTAQVSIVSDPLPQVYEGIPLRLREMAINLTKPQFTRNATSCGTGKVQFGLRSGQGGEAAREADLPTGNCAKQGFSPKLKLEFRNRKEMAKNKHPQVRATMTQPNEQAGLKSVKVTLPKSVALAAANARGLCEVAQAAADKCPKNSIVGSAQAESPILNRTLKGPVYFVKGERTDPKTGRKIATLPTLQVALRGETTIIARAETAVDKKSRLVTTFAALPDAPITRFTMTISGGKRGIIASTRSLCTAPKSQRRGVVSLRGHNGVAAKTQKPSISTACKKKATKKKSSKKKSSKASSSKKSAVAPVAARD